ncbi:hypothetical protein JCM6882_008665 [Rhodosporidiobolus microsporus]
MPKGAKRAAAARAAAEAEHDAGMDVDMAGSPPKNGGKKGQGQAKRKAGADDEDESDEERQGSDVEMLDVSFSFFDPQPQDYHSFKHLFSQLLQGDAAALDLGGVADLVLEQKLVGSTVKTDSGEGDEKAREGDPYAVLTVLNLNVHRTNPALASLTSYLLSKLPSSSPFHQTLSSLLETPADGSSAAERKHVGLVLSERLVNMPVQVVPPMYRMLGEELDWAREDGEPYHFHSLLFLSRVFRSSASQLEEDPNAALEAQNAVLAGSASAGKKGGAGAAGGKGNKKKKMGQHVGQEEKEEEQTWLYHAEDEFIQKFSTHHHIFNYTQARRTEGGGEQDAFGVDARGQLMLVPWDKFGEIVEGMEGFVGGV